MDFAAHCDPSLGIIRLCTRCLHVSAGGHTTGLFIFDMDGTLISSYMDAPNRRYATWHVLPGRREMLAELRKQGHRVGIATNQAGVAFGHVTESQVTRKIEAVLIALGLPEDTPVAVCFAHPHAKAHRYRNPVEVARRKPSGSMLRELIEATSMHEDVVYVGDQPDDRRAARDAHVAFRLADDFFIPPAAPLIGDPESKI